MQSTQIWVQSDHLRKSNSRIALSALVMTHISMISAQLADRSPGQSPDERSTVSRTMGQKAHHLLCQWRSQHRHPLKMAWDTNTCKAIKYRKRATIATATSSARAVLTRVEKSILHFEFNRSTSLLRCSTHFLSLRPQRLRRRRRSCR